MADEHVGLGEGRGGGGSIQIDDESIRHFQNGWLIHDQFVCWSGARPPFTKLSEGKRLVDWEKRTEESCERIGNALKKKKEKEKNSTADQETAKFSIPAAIFSRRTLIRLRHCQKRLQKTGNYNKNGEKNEWRVWKTWKHKLKKASFLVSSRESRKRVWKQYYLNGAEITCLRYKPRHQTSPCLDQTTRLARQPQPGGYLRQIQHQLYGEKKEVKWDWDDLLVSCWAMLIF